MTTTSHSAGGNSAEMRTTKFGVHAIYLPDRWFVTAEENEQEDLACVHTG